MVIVDVAGDPYLDPPGFRMLRPRRRHAGTFMLDFNRVAPVGSGDPHLPDRVDTHPIRSRFGFGEDAGLFRDHQPAGGDGNVVGVAGVSRKPGVYSRSSGGDGAAGRHDIVADTPKVGVNAVSDAQTGAAGRDASGQVDIRAERNIFGSQNKSMPSGDSEGKLRLVGHHQTLANRSIEILGFILWPDSAAAAESCGVAQIFPAFPRFCAPAHG